MKLDVKDRKLLFEIDFNARLSYSSLSGVLNMSKRGVEYKLKNLESKGVILGFYPVIDITSFGFNYFRVFIDLINLTHSLEKSIENYILSDDNIGWAIWTYGEFRIGFTIWARSVTDFKIIVDKFYNKFRKNINKRIESVVVELFFLKNKFLIGKTNFEKLSLKENSELVKYDNLDLLLLKELSINPRRKLVELASSLNEPVKKISYRLKSLFERKILLAIRPSINYSLLNKTYYKILMEINEFDSKRLGLLESFLVSDVRTIYLVKAMGDSDIEIELIVSSNEELFSFINKIQEQFPNLIKSFRTVILTKTIKVKFLPNFI